MTTRPRPGAPALTSLVALAAVATLAGLAAAVPLAAAAPAAQASPVELVDQTGFVAPEGEFVARLQITGAPPDASMRWVVHQRVRSRSEFTRSIGGEGLRTVLLDRTRALSELSPAADTVTVRIPVRASGNDPARLRLTSAGVYPVELELLDQRGTTIDVLVTHLVRVPGVDDESPPLSVALVLPVHAGPALRPDGSVAVDETDQDALTVTTTALRNHPEVALTLAVTPETVDALAEGVGPGDVELLASLREAVGGRPVLGLPYVRMPVPSFVAAGLDAELVASLDRGVDVLTDQLGARVDRDTWIGGNALDDGTVATLARLGIDRFVVPEQLVSPIDEADFPVTLTQTFELGPGRGPRAAQADAGLQAHLATSSQPVLAAHLLLADLATLYFDAPSLERGAVILPPVSWAPAPGFLAALFRGLEGSPIFDAVDLPTWFATVPVANADGPQLPGTNGGADPLVRDLEGEPPLPLDEYPASLRRARRDIEVYGSMIGPSSARADPLERLVLVSQAEGMTTDTRLRYLDAVAQTVRRELAKIEAPERQTITLTARTGRVPIVVRSELGYPVQVRLLFDSDRVEFPGHPRGLLLSLTEEITRVEVPVRTRGPGDAPVDVVITSPDGEREIARVRYRVRSTAVSGVGLVLSAGAGLFLVVWWAREARRTRRARRANRHPAGGAG